MSLCGERDEGEDESELEKLCNFVDDTDRWINQTLATLGWTQEHVVKAEDRVECPVNSGHSVTHQSLDKHVKYCPLISKGYTKNEIDAEESSKFCYARSPLVVSIDLGETVLRNILATSGDVVPHDLPATMSRVQTSLSTAMRRRIYDYCVEVARSSNTSSHIADEELLLLEDTRSNRPLSKLELMAKMRDMKRRRQSYRGKSTHTANKNYTEVMRDVLNNQMELLANIWAEEAKETEEKKRREAREDSAADRHRSRPHFKSRERSRDRRRSKSRESSRHSRHHDESETKERRHSSSKKRKHSRSRSRSKSQRKYKHGRHHSRHEEKDKSADSDSVETVADANSSDKKHVQ